MRTATLTLSRVGCYGFSSGFGRDAMELLERERQLTLRLVYFGPPGSGKAANLQRIHDLLPPEGRSRLRAFTSSDGSSRPERTVSFDMALPSVTADSWAVKLQVFAFSSPLLKATKVATLTVADAIVFVADASRARRDENHEAVRECEEVLRANRRPPPPLVLQINKRDREDAVDEDEIEREWGDRSWPILTASADRGAGVNETFTCLLRVAYEAADRDGAITKKTGLTLDGVVESLLVVFRRPAGAPRSGT